MLPPCVCVRRAVFHPRSEQTKLLVVSQKVELKEFDIFTHHVCNLCFLTACPQQPDLDVSSLLLILVRQQRANSCSWGSRSGGESHRLQRVRSRSLSASHFPSLASFPSSQQEYKERGGETREGERKRRQLITAEGLLKAFVLG